MSFNSRREWIFNDVERTRKQTYSFIWRIRNCFFTFAPLCKVFLSDAYDKNGFHVKLNAPRFSEEALKKNKVVVDLVNKIAKEKKAIVAQISLAWVLAQKDFIVPIPGTTKLERLKENIKATEIKFTKAEVESMNEALSQMNIESRRFEPDSDFEKRVDL